MNLIRRFLKVLNKDGGAREGGEGGDFGLFITLVPKVLY